MCVTQCVSVCMDCETVQEEVSGKFSTVIIPMHTTVFLVMTLIQ